MTPSVARRSPRRTKPCHGLRFERVGNFQLVSIQQTDHILEPWEKCCHALADVLDFHKILSTEEKRRGVESLGADLIGKLTYFERWIVAFANILFQKQVLTPDELAKKMEEVGARYPANPTP